MNGYCKIEIAGQLVGLKFAYDCVKQFALACQAKPNIYVDESGLTDIGIVKLMESAYKNNCLIAESDPVLTMEDFYNAFETLSATSEGVQQIADILRVYGESTIAKKLIENIEKKSPPEVVTSP